MKIKQLNFELNDLPVPKRARQIGRQTVSVNKLVPFKEFHFGKRKAEANLLLGENIKQETG